MQAGPTHALVVATDSIFFARPLNKSSLPQGASARGVTMGFPVKELMSWRGLTEEGLRDVGSGGLSLLFAALLHGHASL
jgi:hypothetical protein